MDCGHVTAKLYVQCDNNSYTVCIIHAYTSRVVFPVTVEPVEGMRLDSFLSFLPRTLFCFARI